MQLYIFFLQKKKVLMCKIQIPKSLVKKMFRISQAMQYPV